MARQGLKPTLACAGVFDVQRRLLCLHRLCLQLLLGFRFLDVLIDVFEVDQVFDAPLVIVFLGTFGIRVQL